MVLAVTLSNTEVTNIVAIGCGVLALGAYVGLLLVPAWKSYSRIWQRVAASFMSLYILAACLGLGLLGAGAVVWFWDRFTG